MNKILISLLLLVVGCTSLRSVSTSSIPAQRTKKVSAQADKFVVLGFNFNNQYVDGVVQDLAKQCPSGRVEGILTKQETINYFLFIFWKSNITAQGYCVGGKNVAVRGKGRVPSADEEVVEESAE